jgi:DNA protecting protein DprA
MEPTPQRDLFTPPEQTPEPIPFGAAVLALGSVRGLGQKALKTLVFKLKDALGAVFSYRADAIAEVLRGNRVAAAEKLAQQIAEAPGNLIERGQDQLRQLRDRGIQVLSPSEIPAQLQSTGPDAPQWLFVQGDRELLNRRPAIAVVGTRNPTDRGLEAAATVTKMLAAYPVTLISGLAEGIDEVAHSNSLAYGMKNVAFLGHGIDIVFPAKTADLREEIIRKNGAVVTEYLPWEHPQKRFFVERNRLQAGLADLVLPIEANPTGGTAHTIRFARAYHRRVVGVRWPGANGVIQELDEAGDTVIDINSSSGRRHLDGIVRQLVEENGGQAYPLVLIERWLLREIRSRDTRPQDIERIIESLTALKQEPPSNGSSERRDIRR